MGSMLKVVHARTAVIDQQLFVKLSQTKEFSPELANSSLQVCSWEGAHRCKFCD